jgi:hypothetical protein
VERSPISSDAHVWRFNHPEALVHRAGVALYIGPTGYPVLIDREGACQIIREAVNKLNGKGRRRTKDT